MAPVFTWNDRYLTGDAEIDSDHRRLVLTVNEMFEAMSAGESERVSHFLRVLGWYARYHFAREECLMEQAAYPNAERHRQAHEDFKTRFQGSQEPDPKVLILQLSVFLVDWLDHHFMVEDRELFEYMRALPEGPET